jgi:hypothetical protein
MYEPTIADKFALIIFPLLSHFSDVIIKSFQQEQEARGAGVLVGLLRRKFGNQSKAMSRNSYTMNGSVPGDETSRMEVGNYRNNSGGVVAGQTIILEGNFFVFPKKKLLYKVTVTEQCLSIESLSSNGNKRLSNSARRGSFSSVTLPSLIDFKDVIGCHVMKGKDSGDQNAYFCVFHYPHKKKLLAKKSSRRRQTTTFAVHKGETFEENMVIAEHWKKVVVCLSRGLELHGKYCCFCMKTLAPLVLS